MREMKLLFTTDDDDGEQYGYRPDMPCVTLNHGSRPIEMLLLDTVQAALDVANEAWRMTTNPLAQHFIPIDVSHLNTQVAHLEGLLSEAQHSYNVLQGSEEGDTSLGDDIYWDTLMGCREDLDSFHSIRVDDFGDMGFTAVTVTDGWVEVGSTGTVGKDTVKFITETYEE